MVAGAAVDSKGHRSVKSFGLHGEDRAVQAPQNSFGSIADEKAPNAGSTQGAHDNHVSTYGIGDGSDSVCRVGPGNMNLRSGLWANFSVDESLQATCPSVLLRLEKLSDNLLSLLAT